MIEFKFNFVAENGMHARPAGELVRKVSDLKSKVEISVDGKDKFVAADGIFSVMGLGIKKDDVLIFRVYGVRNYLMHKS